MIYNPDTVLVCIVIMGIWNILNIFQLDSKISKETGEVFHSREYILPILNHIIRFLTVMFISPYVNALPVSELARLSILILIALNLGTIVETFVRFLLTSRGEKHGKPYN